MTALLHPGVFVQEVPGGVRAIEGVPTSTTIFVGETERGPLTPTKIKGVSDYERLFGGYLRPGSARVTTRYAIDAFFRNGGTSAYVLRAIDGDAVTARGGYTDTVPNAEIFPVEASSPGTWGNGLKVIFGDSSDGDTSRFRLIVFAEDLATGETNFVEDWDRLSLDTSDENYVGDVLLRSTYIRWVDGAGFSLTAFNDGAAGFSGSPANWDVSAVPAMTGGTLGAASYSADAELGALLPALDGIEDAALIVGSADIWAADSAPDEAAAAGYYESLRTYVDARPKRDLFYIADLPNYAGSATTAVAATSVTTLVDGGGETFSRSDMAGVYWPHLEVNDPVGATSSSTIILPPSATVAGLYARTDSRRGVWKAPAGTEVTVGGISGLSWDVLDKHQDDLNPRGVNAIRVIPGAGTVVWGSRTLKPSSEWRYIPVRRTAMFLRKSIFNGIQWAVFEPNGDDLWASLRATIGAFMETQFRNGAFAGTTSREAYFVKVDSETTTEIDQAAGIVNILVGFAPLRPAEFVVVKLSQKTASAG
ncbi:phage tail sheath family protein [Pseudenhygromyxa sp. WMMC2535]|uniref:phage tail sheath family protein n=1 Tax=Pseudenhygromyxa sp. WMMC2535 TaxID=2712867 RepID=UPI0015530A9F|nr:phage tail sheath subtilisin-like domain-containing protein [Pseudenhygromyxa sp. WMMC2535]NVB37043.1 phage tail sheath family protein [Pseudenhygromyxa sp. WMMC2535]